MTEAGGVELQADRESGGAWSWVSYGALRGGAGGVAHLWITQPFLLKNVMDGHHPLKHVY